jgi:hypothetical protein
MRAPRSLLEAAVNAQNKTYEQRLADLVRRLGTEHDGEIIATVRALKRSLESRGLTFTDLGDGIEKLATGGLTQGEMERIRDASYAKGLADAERKFAEVQTVFGLRSDGSTDWEEIALYCQREKARVVEAKSREFVDDMASRMTWGREPSEKQGKYLLSIFRQLGGRVA